MARHDTRNWPDGSKMTGLLCLVASILVQHGTLGQTTKGEVVVEPEVESYPGEIVTLRCSISTVDGVRLQMLSWIYESKDGTRLNIAVLHPEYGPNYPDSPMSGRVQFVPSSPSINNPSIQISDVKMTDEGKYICEFATFPNGNKQGITQLVMLAKPRNSASIVTVDAGTQPTVVARCESVDGRPASKISWVTTATGNATTSTQAGSGNTMTVSSEYVLVPTPADNGRDINCVVEHRTQVKPESMQLKLIIQYPPEVKIQGYDNNWYMGRTNAVLTCEAKANPIPTTVNWKTMSGEIPDSVEIIGNELKVLKVDEAVNTTFVCEVKNRLGTGKSQVTILIRGTPLRAKGAATGSIIGAIIGVVIFIAIIGTGIAMYRKYKNKKFNGERPPKHKPPPPQKKNSAPKQVNSSPPTRDNEYSIAPTAEQAMKPDDYNNDDAAHNGGYYYSGAPHDWDNPSHSEALLYNMESDQGLNYPSYHVNREDSFVSSPMIV